MNIEEYEDIEEGANASSLNKIYEIFFDEAPLDSKNILLQKLNILCDKQWHTYELPSKDVQNKIEGLIISNWDESNFFLELALRVCYCFGLSKELYNKALDSYNGDCIDEYEDNLKNSHGDYIDPYWSMK